MLPATYRGMVEPLALREAYEAAQEVDREQGTLDPDEPMDGPTALPIVDLLARVEEEVFGPTGRGEGTRG